MKKSHSIILTAIIVLAFSKFSYANSKAQNLAEEKQRASAAVTAGNFSEAIPILESIVEKDEVSSHMHLNLGLCYFKDKQYYKAYRMLIYALTLSDDAFEKQQEENVLTEKEKKTLIDYLTHLRSKLKLTTMHIEITPADADVWIDEKPYGTSSLNNPYVLQSGSHTLLIKKAGYRDKRKNFIVDEDNARNDLFITMKASPSTHEVQKPRNWPIVLSLVAGAGLVGLGIALDIKGSRDEQELHDEQYGSIDKFNELKKTTAIDAWMMFGSFAIGGACLVFGTVKLISRMRKKPHEKLHQIGQESHFKLLPNGMMTVSF